MRLDLVLPILGAALSAAQHVNVVIPQTERYVSSMLSRFQHYTDYTAPASATAASSPKVTPAAVPNAAKCSFWMENIEHQGIAAFNSNPKTYTVFRNVKDYGAKGDGVTDDTAAINAAISAGNRFGPASRTTSTTTPAVVYFPAGTYLISTSIIDYYYTQIIGNPNCLPVLKATPGFSGFGLIDGDQYQSDGQLGWGATNVFYRQVRNFIFDMTAIPATSAATGIHWPTAQATSIQNCVFKMSSNSGTQHQGVFIESGSGGWMTDLVFQGGLYGMNQGNQQFTMRNLTFSNCVTAISQIWDWGWTYKGVKINNCTIGLDMSSGGSTAQSVAGIVMLDSTISNTPVGIKTAHSKTSSPDASGALVLENVVFKNVPVAVQRSDGTTILAGSTGTTSVAAWAQGHRYNPTGPTDLNGNNVAPDPRPASLVSGTAYYQRSKPQYEAVPVGRFLSVRSQGAKGDGVTDDTVAVQKALNAAKAAGKVCFFDAGDYLITKTITIPANLRVVGETYSVILSSGPFFNKIKHPQPVVSVGAAGESGTVEWSDMIVSTKGPQTGAILIQWNLASPAGSPSGMWDVHTRVGGFTGSGLEVADCPTTPNKTVTGNNYVKRCRGAYLAMHITPEVKGLYLENNWFWTADHDIDEGPQLTIYTGRGMLVESTTGPVWLYGTAVEHNVLYQYQLLNTSNVLIAAAQTETAYYQPNPNATVPFPTNTNLGDPLFPNKQYKVANPSGSGKKVSVPNAEGWGMRVVHSSMVNVYGAGFYSFFDNYSTGCSDQGNGSVCQSRILDLEGGSGVRIYDLHTVGTRVMLEEDGVDRIQWSDNQAGFSDEVAVFKP